MSRKPVLFLRVLSTALSAIALVLPLQSCSSSSGPSHTSEEYKAAKLLTNHLEAYQDTYAGDDDWIVSADGDLTFADGTTESNNIQLHYDGRVAQPDGYCIFDLDDDRQALEGTIDPPKLVKRCDGKTAQLYQIGENSVWITGHPVAEDDLSTFHIDSISGPKSLLYYTGHSPSANSDDNDDH